MCDDSTIYCSDTSHRVDTTDIETYTINGNRETSYFDTRSTGGRLNPGQEKVVESSKTAL